MGKLSNYLGSVELASGVKGKNDNDIPLMEAHSVAVSNSDGRLDDLLNIMINYCKGVKVSGSGDGVSSAEKETKGYYCSLDIEFSSMAKIESVSITSYTGFNATPTVTIRGNIATVSGYSNIQRNGCSAKVEALLMPNLLKDYADISYANCKNCVTAYSAKTCTNGKVSETRFMSQANSTAPDDVIVTNCDYTWDKSTGILTMSNPRGDIDVSVIYTYSLSITTVNTDGDTVPCLIGDYDSVIADTSTPIKVKLAPKTQPSTGKLYTPAVYTGSTGATFSIEEDPTSTQNVYILTISNITTNVKVFIAGQIS